MQGFPDPRNPHAIKGKGEIIPCEECEDGFKYKQLVSDTNGKS